MHPQTILDRIAELPRIQLAHKNTPFEEMPRLRAAIADSMGTDISAIPPLFIKRDDTTGFAFGGNKARHMEFMFAHLIERGIDTIVNINHYDSNNARLAAAASAKTDIKYHWVAYDMIDEPVQGNMLIAHLAGAQIYRVPDMQTARPLAEKLRDQEIKNGRNATILSDNPFFDIAGMIGFLETAAELDTQISNYTPPSRSVRGRERSERGMPEDPRHSYENPRHSREETRHSRERGRFSGRHVHPEGKGRVSPARGGNVRRTKGDAPTAEDANPFPHASNTPIHFWGLCGRSIAGIRLYARNTGKPWTATAVAQPHYNPENYQEIYLDRSNRVAKLLNLDAALEPGDIDTLTGYTITYGIPTELGIEAMHLVAKTEGIILDPTYTGKSMSALIAEIRKNNLDPDTPITFIHSGGLPQTFAFPNQIWNSQPNPPTLV